MFLESKNADCNLLYLCLNNDTCRGKSKRIDRALQCVALMNLLVENTGIDITEKVEYFHLKEIMNIFEPESDVLRADMAAALFFKLCRVCSRGWLPPVSFLVTSFVHARRIKEAKHVASSVPNLTIGPQKKCAEDFIREMTGKSRMKKDIEPYSEKVIESMIRRWKIFS